MIKRQDYKLLHPRSNDEASSSSSSSQESSLSEKAESEDDAESVQSPDEEDWQEESSVPEPENVPRFGRVATDGGKVSQWAQAVDETEKERVLDGIDESVVLRTGRNEGVSRCRLCPKTICLSDDTMRAHLSSNGHARAVLRFAEGKLKVVLNSDGEEESADEGETHTERLRRTIAVTQQAPKKEVKKQQSGRQRQRLRAKKKAEAAAKKSVERTTPAAKTNSGSQTAETRGQGKPDLRNGHPAKKRKDGQVVLVPDTQKESMKKRTREGRKIKEGSEKSKKRNKAIQE